MLGTEDSFSDADRLAERVCGVTIRAGRTEKEAGRVEMARDLRMVIPEVRARDSECFAARLERALVIQLLTQQNYQRSQMCPLAMIVAIETASSMASASRIIASARSNSPRAINGFEKATSVDATRA